VGAVRYVVLYDADCGFCRWTMAQIVRWDRHGVVAPRQIQSEIGERLLEPVPVGERLESWHLVRGDGCVYSSGAAFVPLLAALPGGGPLARLSTRCPAAAERSYRWVAHNRSTLSKAVPRRAKVAADRLIEQRERLTEDATLPDSTRRC
jgi:predicted DCC family thiol-disulfide oxidoreductase YuxK